MRIALHVLLWLAVLAVAPLFADDRKTAEPPAFRIAAYLPEYREFDPAAARGLTDLILFSATPAESGKLDLSRLRRLPWAKLRAFKTQERIRLILCVGGWERSTHFAVVAASDERRREFVQSAVRVCLDERLDGLDLDWEHPRNEAEQEGYARLLTELRKAFEPLGLTLTVTVAAWQKLPAKAFDVVDWVNVMAYDHPGRHSTLEGAQADVKKLIEAGAPARKITLGLPFYGRDVAKRGRTLTYREIIAKHHPGPGVDEIDNVFFNGPDTIVRKARYARESGLAGVMVWEIGQDASGEDSLLKVIRAEIERSGRK